jgi:S1-C subfamily serine protease
MRSLWKAVCASACLGTSPALALPPDQIFERVAPAVWSVKAYTAEEKLLASASGIAVAPGKLVTSCQVLARARQVQVRRGNSIYDAKLEFPDVERDLCQLDVPGLAAPAPVVGSVRALKPGQRLYVVGFARGNEQSIGEGLVSVVSEAGTGKERLQTTVPASPGLLGAGVFDEEARLVGIVTASPKDAAASAFAVPADWLAELAERGQAALAAHSKPAAPGSAAAVAPAAPGHPASGTSRNYANHERI